MRFPSRAALLLVAACAASATPTAAVGQSGRVPQNPGAPADSTLELDYWGLTGLLATEELEADRSAGEIWACLEAMELGDVDESRRRYSELAAWWEQIRSVERAN